MTTARSPRPDDADRTDPTTSPSSPSSPAPASTAGSSRSDTGTTDDTRPSSDPAAEKPVEEWVTGDEPMTGPQRSYLQTLAREAGEELPEEELTKAAASELIERLQRATGRIPADRQR